MRRKITGAALGVAVLLLAGCGSTAAAPAPGFTSGVKGVGAGITTDSALMAACNRLAQGNVLSHASASSCYRCEVHGALYEWYTSMAPSGPANLWICTNPRY